jgi:hypothetical protein
MMKTTSTILKTLTMTNGVEAVAVRALLEGNGVVVAAVVRPMVMTVRDWAWFRAPKSANGCTA